jgi:hypothetical protein
MSFESTGASDVYNPDMTISTTDIFVTKELVAQHTSNDAGNTMFVQHLSNMEFWPKECMCRKSNQRQQAEATFLASSFALASAAPLLMLAASAANALQKVFMVVNTF